jgi:hypothetical protein
MGILREWFGPSKEEIWRQLAEQMGGQYIDGGFWRDSKVQAEHGQWTITLDTYTESSGDTSSTYTRLRTPYVNRDNFYFTVYRKSIFSGLGKWLGMQDVEVGFEPFDEDFIIQGNNEKRLRELFGNARIRQLISAQPNIHFQVKDDEGWFAVTFPEGVDELYFSASGVIKDIGQLRSLFEMFAEVLDHLCLIGSAYKNHPGIIV